MNKQYKVIWSKVKNTYVVVSELAKRNGKSESGSSRQYVSAAAVLAAVAVLSILVLWRLKMGLLLLLIRRTKIFKWVMEPI